MNLKWLLNLAVQAAEAASKEVLAIYHSGDFQAEAKGDQSPLTRADKKAHETIAAILQSSELPLLSEEGRSISYAERKQWDYFWMVDPLDGTKEFLKRNDEFTVNIALIHKGVPILGVVAVPVTGDVFYADEVSGGFVKRNGVVSPIIKRNAIDLAQAGLRIVASRSHMSEETQQFIYTLAAPTLVSQGSSLKFMLLAEGKADVYPRFAPTMEWDTAAAHAVVKAAGLKVLQYGTDSEVVYNKPELLNPWFLVK